MTILFVSDDDRSALACQLLAQQLEQRGQACLTIGPALSSRRDSPLPSVAPQIPLNLMDLLGHELLNSASAVGVFIRRKDHLQRFTNAHRELARQRGVRPAVVFSGPLEASLGDKLVRQLSDRQCCDLLVVPGERQRRELEAITQFWPHTLDTPDIEAIGHWFSPERPPLGCLNGGTPTPPHTLLALVQEAIPTQVGAKAQLLRQLIRWAETSPDWSIVIQRDHAWEKGQPWISKFKSSDWSFPDNLVFGAPGQLLSQLASCSACLSVSSPWSLTAMAWGRPTLLIGDYGIHTKQGTTAFFGSGLMHRMQTIDHLDQLLALPPVNASWLQSMGWGVHDGAARLIRRLEELVP